MPFQDIRWEQRFANYKKALDQLQRFIDKGELSELEKQGLVKAFEYTFELAWNTLKDFLGNRGQTDSYGSRDAISKAFTLGLIQDTLDLSIYHHIKNADLLDHIERVGKIFYSNEG